MDRTIRQVVGHCCHWFNDMTAAAEDPIAVIQWPVELLTRQKYSGQIDG
jgi:hypothetical protein